MTDQYWKMPTIRDHAAQTYGNIQLLGDYYSIKTIATGLTKASRIVLRGGSIYYQNRDGSAHRTYKLKKGKKEFINDPNVDYFNETCLFDSELVTFTNAEYLEFGNTVIITPSLHTKYKVAHHLEKKVFFIASAYDHTAIAEPLYCADVSSSQGEVLAKVGFDVNIKDIAIDQYTGDIFLLELTGEIKCFKKKHYCADVDTLVNKYVNGGAPSNSKANDVIDITG